MTELSLQSCFRPIRLVRGRNESNLGGEAAEEGLMLGHDGNTGTKGWRNSFGLLQDAKIPRELNQVTSVLCSALSRHQHDRNIAVARLHSSGIWPGCKHVLVAQDRRALERATLNDVVRNSVENSICRPLCLC